MENIIETYNLTKKYNGCDVVNSVNLNVPKGKIYGLLGRNGAGKTTAMKMLIQMVKPTSGSFRLFGEKNVKNNTSVYKNIGSIIETPSFYTNLTAYENLRILNLLRGERKSSHIMRSLEIVGLDKEKTKSFAQYSLGMKQRLGIAAAIMHEPKLLILDEPINGLDPIGILEIRSFLSELSKKNGTTILISSHVLNEIEQIADIIGVMHEGKLIKELEMAKLNKCKRKYTEFAVSNTKLASKLLQERYHIKNLDIVENTIRIADCTHHTGEINKAFVEIGLLVTKVHSYEESLENYFSNLIGGKGIA
ncbi:ATP-binding cassette domain-containing protein [Acetoanaerobium sticklandii]|uniref:ATP-binding cassette domain-containing protein n=1 Tax=Acetoanaerobium sticklandii TaxID=1511 RepID=UPI003A8CAA19